MAYVINAANLQPVDYTTTYDLSDGDTDLIIQISTRCSINVDVVAGAFDYPSGTTYGTDLTGTLDATVDFNSSADGVNKQGVDGATQIVLDSAKKVAGWQVDIFEPANAHITIVQNNVVTGTVRVLITIKPLK